MVTDETVATDISGTFSSLLTEIFSLATIFADNHREGAISSGGMTIASTPCSKAKATPWTSISSDIDTAILVPLLEAAATIFSKGIIFQSEHLSITHGTIPIREIASSWPLKSSSATDATSGSWPSQTLYREILEWFPYFSASIQISIKSPQIGGGLIRTDSTVDYCSEGINPGD